MAQPPPSPDPTKTLSKATTLSVAPSSQTVINLSRGPTGTIATVSLRDSSGQIAQQVVLPVAVAVAAQAAVLDSIFDALHVAAAQSLGFA